ncbi:MAG: hypothetical protein ACR5K2_00990 [Wolbachia sp.]
MVTVGATVRSFSQEILNSGVRKVRVLLLAELYKNQYVKA